MYYRCLADAYPYPEYEWYDEVYKDDQVIYNKVDALEDARFTISGGALIIYAPDQVGARAAVHRVSLTNSLACLSTNVLGCFEPVVLWPLSLDSTVFSLSFLRQFCSDAANFSTEKPVFRHLFSVLYMFWCLFTHLTIEKPTCLNFLCRAWEKRYEIAERRAQWFANYITIHQIKSRFQTLSLYARGS